MVFFYFYTKKIRFILSLFFLIYSFYLPQWPIFSAKLPADQFFSIDTLVDAAVFEVTNTFDPTDTIGDPTYTGSLRQAIDLSNSNSEADTIYFNATVTTIYLNTTLTLSEGNLTITGTKDTAGNNGPGVELVQGNTVMTTGFYVEFSADDNIFQSLAINSFSENFDSAIYIAGGSTQNVVRGCYLGTDLTGTVDKANSWGININGDLNTIGGNISITTNRNVINGDAAPIRTQGSGNSIIGNYLGVDVSGTLAFPSSSYGIDLSGTGNTVGSLIDPQGFRNIIFADSGNCLLITGSYHAIEGNYIGTDITGSADPGFNGYGIQIAADASSNSIVGNTIAFNNSYGIFIDRASTLSSGNRISQNIIFDNDKIGINLDANGDTLNGTTSNDASDFDTGPNGYLNFPLIAQAVLDGSGNFTVTGTLDVAPTHFATTMTIEVFIADDNPADNDGHGEGKTYLESTMPTSDATGSWSITITGTGLVVGDLITADVTDSAGNTSEFSLNVTVTILTHSFMVTTTADFGAGSLRSAVDFSNINGNDSQDVIYFAPTVTTIFLNSTLTLSSGNLLLTGTKDPTGINGPGVEITTTVADIGLNITTSSSIIQGIAIYGFATYDIYIQNLATNNQILGCHIGTDIAGTIDGGSNIGIRLEGDNNIIGGDITDSTQRNIIIGCLNDGIVVVGGDNNTIQGNYIGVNSSGNTAVGSNQGIRMDTGQNNMIGGVTITARNIISGNGDGIRFMNGGGAGTFNTIQNNYIGTNFDGTGSISNTNNGIRIDIDSASNNTIVKNLIANNGGDGIEITASVVQNKISQNTIFDNGNLAIDLNGDSVTNNDLDDTDIGPNNLLNFPIITQARVDGSGNLVVTGTLDIGGAETTSTVEVFIADNNPANNDNHGEGKTYLGSTMPTSDTTGSWSITITGTGVVVGDLITADLTDSAGSTSEFSLNVTVTLDTDGDGVLDSADNCDSIANADQTDTDSDGAGNACDSDDDNDGVSDNSDAFPEDPTETLDTDSDGLGNNVDQDDDSDGYSDSLENSVGSDALSNGSFPRRLNAPYVSIDTEICAMSLVSNTNSTKTIAYNIYDNDGGFAFSDTVQIGSKVGTLIDLLDPSILTGMGAHILGHIELYYSGNSGDMSANVIMDNNNGIATSPFIDLQNIGSNILGGVWLVSKAGDASVYASNTSDDSIRAYIRVYDQDGNILNYEEFILNGHQMRTFAMPDEKIGYVRIVLIDGNAGDVIAQLVITDTKYGNSSHLLVDPNLQLSSEEYKSQNNMGHKVAPIMYKPIVQGKDSKGFIILGNIGYESIDVYTSLLKKEGQVKLNKATIPSYGTIKQKIHTVADENIYGVDIYHEGGGSTVVGNVLVSNGNTDKSSVSYLLMDTTPSDLNTSVTISERGFDLINGTKAKVILRNISNTERHVTLNFYNLEGVLLATTNVSIKKNKIAKVSINKLISEETLGHVELIHDGSAGDVKGSVVMSVSSSGPAYQSPFIDRDSEL